MTNDEKRQMTVDLAEKVMGWRQVYAFESPSHYHYKYESSSGGWFYIDAEQSHPTPWTPLDSIADAWMLVDALMKTRANVSVDGISETPVAWRCIVSRAFVPHEVGFGATAPEAICRAALAAVSR